jgi:hypothetical protein
MSHVKISQSGMSSSVVVDGQDVSRMVSAATVQMAAGAVPRVTLQFIANTEWEGDADVVSSNDYWVRTADWLRGMVGHPAFVRRCTERMAASTMADDPNDLVLMVLADLAAEGFDVDSDGA